jgi:hypothetical protein
VRCSVPVLSERTWYGRLLSLPGRVKWIDFKRCWKAVLEGSDIGFMDSPMQLMIFKLDEAGYQMEGDVLDSGVGVSGTNLPLVPPGGGKKRRNTGASERQPLQRRKLVVFAEGKEVDVEEDVVDVEIA